MIRRLLVAAALALALVAPINSAANASPTVGDGHGLTVVGANLIDARQTEYTVSTAALKHPVHVRVVMPTGYDPSSATRYPVLYLYHGTSGRPSDWITSGDALATTGNKNLILVLPEAGYDGDGGGFFNNEWNGGKGGGSQWETFEYDQVVPWIDQNFPTLADRDHRAIAGLSQGGYGAMQGAALHPDEFTSVASFSGAPEIFRNSLVRLGADTVIEAITVGLNKQAPFTILGDPVTNSAHWQGHDPGTLAESFHGMDVNLWTATGIPGALDSPATLYGGVSGNVIEAATHLSTLAFQSHLRSAGIATHYVDYVLGTHSFPYWARDLRQYLPILMNRFAHPSTPTVISYASTAMAYTQWGWDVTVDRDAAEKLTTLKAASKRGFSYVGSDPATIVTPPWFVPGSVKYVEIATSAGARTTEIEVDSGGRLTVPIPQAGNVWFTGTV